MSKPPPQLDGADVLCWALSHSPSGFYSIEEGDSVIVVSAMAICRYGNEGPHYLFKCDSTWQVVNDWDCESVDEAMKMAAQQIREWTGNTFDAAWEN